MDVLIGQLVTRDLSLGSILLLAALGLRSPSVRWA